MQRNEHVWAWLFWHMSSRANSESHLLKIAAQLF